ncbi:alpha/beta hydrolase [Sphingobium sp. HBC34]|uniref:Alpha/beta hydrolase n=1 Tax=Sphingobium cyanobacteriorum TaxID=3063954 RepID=A0ABT8ZLX0_9SPHN|nr:alpha/beta hydrolase [Sphingobium sp. HBC34]MDO7835528.1 alpha/beta hydrolase [Sphingobium sp. HBC34]
MTQASPPAPVQKAPGEREGFIQSHDGLSLRVREWGPQDGDPIVLLHGLRGYSGTWRGLAAALPDRRLIAIDQRGRGESSWDPACNYYTDAYLADLETVVAQLGLDRFTLIGHSMGGTTAYVYAAHNPDRLDAVIIEDIAPGSSASGAGAERIKAEMAALPTDFADWAEGRAYWRNARPSVSEAAREERLAESLRETADGRIGWRYDAAGISRTRLDPDPARVVDLWPVVDAIRTPAFIIRGGRSDFCRLDTVLEMERRNPRFTHATVAAASHYVHDDAPDIFNALVEGWLAGVRSAVAGGASI